MVDLPQHLHLISVLHRLDDPTTLYPRVFAARAELTPYLGYYVPVNLMAWLVPIELANRLFLSAMVLGLPLATAFLLRSLGRPRWPAVLTVPFAYGDSFGWGFVNSSASFVLALLAAGLFLRALTDAPRRRRWAVAHAMVLVAVVLMHVQGFLFLALALPFLLLTTRVPEDGPARPLRPRLPALLSTVPAVALFGVWGAGRLLAPAEVEEGAPWKAWGPLLSERNLSFKPFRQNVDELPDLLANLMRDGGDRWGLRAVTAVALVALVLWIAGQRSTSREGPVERWRLAGLAVLAGLLFLFLPFDIRGAVYYLKPVRAPGRAARGRLGAGHRRPDRPVLVAAGLVAALVLVVPLGGAFHAFDLEAAPLLRFAEETPPGPRIMALVFDPGSRVVRHPVFLPTRRRSRRGFGGITNFSFARTPHSPVRYSGGAATFPSEWRPDGFRWDTMGPAYSHFLIRGVDPRAVFGARFGTEVTPSTSPMVWPGWSTTADERRRAGRGAARRRERTGERPGRGLEACPGAAGGSRRGRGQSSRGAGAGGARGRGGDATGGPRREALGLRGSRGGQGGAARALPAPFRGRPGGRARPWLRGPAARRRSPARRVAAGLRQPARRDGTARVAARSAGPRRGRGGGGAGLRRARPAVDQPRRDGPHRLAEARPEPGDGAAAPLSAEEGRALLAEAARCNLASRTPSRRTATSRSVTWGRGGAQRAGPLPAPEDGDAALAVESGRCTASPSSRRGSRPSPS
jgi:hypothetical protein